VGCVPFSAFSKRYCPQPSPGCSSESAL
jgi:hypothetical protein